MLAFVAIISGLILSPTVNSFAPVKIEVDGAEQFFVTPGSESRIVINLKNMDYDGFFFLSGADEKKFFTGFDNSSVYVEEGQALAITGHIRVPPDANNTVSTLTVIVQRKRDNVTSQRQIILRTKPEPVGDKSLPICDIETAAICERQYFDEDACTGQHRMMRAKIQDADSALFSVGTKPDGRFIGEDFPIGMVNELAIEQEISCCTVEVELTAVDVNGNAITCRTKRDTVHLTLGDIFAFILTGVLLIMIALGVVVCSGFRCKCGRSDSRADNINALELEGLKTTANTSGDDTARSSPDLYPISFE